MKFLYFIFSSSLLIGLILLVRKLFRKKLAPGVIYALWLIPLLRLLIPFASWELPVFGTMAEILNSPYTIVEEFQEARELSKGTRTSEVDIENFAEDNPQTGQTGTKIYDAVIRENEETSEKDSKKENASKNSVTTAIISEWILPGLWITGSVILGIYVVLQNRKIRKSVRGLPVLDEADGLKIYVGDQIKVPCLSGVWKPGILVPGDVFEDSVLYDCALRHELAHYHQKDHIWNMIRILMCVIYWWNPFVWIAVKYAEEDAELACDARVLKNQSVEVRKAYGYALLQMLENVQGRSHSLVMATSMSGSKNSMKRRIQEISQKTTTKKRVLLPVVLVCVILLTLGCAIPTDKSWIKTGGWTNGTTEEVIYSEAEYSFVLQDPIKSMLYYREIYEYGQLKTRAILSYGEVDEPKQTMKIRRESSIQGDEEALIMEGSQIGVHFFLTEPEYKYDEKYVTSGSALYSEKGKIEITAEKEYIVRADFKASAGEMAQSYNCEQLSGYTEEELQEAIKDNYITCFVRVVFSELPEMELGEKYEQKEYPSVNEESTENGAAEERLLAEKWAEAFVNRDAETIAEIASEDAYQQLVNGGLMGEDEDFIYFGWSSPWPMFGNQQYEIISCAESGAKIRYYATFSTPHVYVWEEILEFEENDGNLKVRSEILQIYDEICEKEVFYQAYPDGKVTGTMMDYYTNGLGEFLNENALENPEVRDYRVLFAPDTAAAELLNLDRDAESIRCTVETIGETAAVQIHFSSNDGETEVVEVTMWQPYGENGIWIPK